MKLVTTTLLALMTTVLSAQLYVPNAITPNGDGINDVFVVSCLDTLITYDLRVFTLQGELVFQASDPSQVWVGGYDYYAPNGLYNYIVQWRAIGDSQRQKQYGYITILR